MIGKSEFDAWLDHWLTLFNQCIIGLPLIGNQIFFCLVVHSKILNRRPFRTRSCRCIALSFDKNRCSWTEKNEKRVGCEEEMKSRSGHVDQWLCQGQFCHCTELDIVLYSAAQKYFGEKPCGFSRGGIL